jgi:transcriptional regulator with XRE-family HTH domain
MSDNIGPAIALLRAQHNLTQHQVERRAGLGYGQMVRYETGRDQRKLATLARILRVFRIGQAGFWSMVAVLDGQLAAARRSARGTGGSAEQEVDSAGLTEAVEGLRAIERGCGTLRRPRRRKEKKQKGSRATRRGAGSARRRFLPRPWKP